MGQVVGHPHLRHRRLAPCPDSLVGSGHGFFQDSVFCFFDHQLLLQPVILLWSQLVMGQPILQCGCLLVQSHLSLLCTVQVLLFLGYLVQQQFLLSLFGSHLCLQLFHPGRFDLDSSRELAQGTLLQVQIADGGLAPLRLVSHYLNILSQHHQLTSVPVLKLSGVPAEDGLHYQVVLVFLELTRVHLLAVRLERRGVSSHLGHEVENGQAVQPSVRSTDRLEDILPHKARVPQHLQQGEDCLESHLVPFDPVIESSCQNGKHVKEYFGASFFEHVFGDGPESGGVVQLVDLLEDASCHFCYLFGHGLFGETGFGDRAVAGVEGRPICGLCRFGGSAMHVGISIGVHLLKQLANTIKKRQLI